jgi:hypothetical protein
MVTFGVIGGLVLLWLGLDLWAWRQRSQLVTLESQYPADVATISLRLTRGFELVRSDETGGLYIWERGRPFDDGGIRYYAQISRDQRTGRGRFVVGVIGHTFHTTEDLVQARSSFVSSQLFHLTAESVEGALVRAADPRTVRNVLPAMRSLAGQRATRVPAIDAPMSPSALRFTLRAPLAVVTDAVDTLPAAGWRRIESTSLERGLVTQRRYCFEDAARREHASAEYLLEVRGYAGDWVLLAIDWFPRPEPARPPRRPSELEALIRVGVERARRAQEQLDFVE